VTKQVSGWGGVSLSGTLLRVTGPLERLLAFVLRNSCGYVRYPHERDLLFFESSCANSCTTEDLNSDSRLPKYRRTLHRASPSKEPAGEARLAPTALDRLFAC